MGDLARPGGPYSAEMLGTSWPGSSESELFAASRTLRAMASSVQLDASMIRAAGNEWSESAIARIFEPIEEAIRAAANGAEEGADILTQVAAAYSRYGDIVASVKGTLNEIVISHQEEIAGTEAAAAASGQNPSAAVAAIIEDGAGYCAATAQSGASACTPITIATLAIPPAPPAGGGGAGVGSSGSWSLNSAPHLGGLHAGGETSDASSLNSSPFAGNGHAERVDNFSDKLDSSPHVSTTAGSNSGVSNSGDPSLTSAGPRTADVSNGASSGNAGGVLPSSGGSGASSAPVASSGGTSSSSSGGSGTPSGASDSAGVGGAGKSSGVSSGGASEPSGAGGRSGVLGGLRGFDNESVAGRPLGVGGPVSEVRPTLSTSGPSLSSPQNVPSAPSGGSGGGGAGEPVRVPQVSASPQGGPQQLSVPVQSAPAGPAAVSAAGSTSSEVPQSASTTQQGGGLQTSAAVAGAERAAAASSMRGVTAAVIAAEEPAPGVVGVPLSPDLLLARTVLDGVLAAAPAKLGLEWAVGVFEHARRGGQRVVVASNDGRGWVPSEVFLPRDVVVPWMFDEPEVVQGAARWTNLTDAGRAVVELAWAVRDRWTLAALTSSVGVPPSVRLRFPNAAVETVSRDRVVRGPRLDLTALTSETRDRLAGLISAEVSDSLDAVPEGEIDLVALQLTWEANALLRWTSPATLGGEAVTGADLRQAILTAMNNARALDPPLPHLSAVVPSGVWQSLRVLASYQEALRQRVDVGGVGIGDFRPDPSSRVGVQTAELRVNEAMLLLEGEPSREDLRDIYYCHQLLKSELADAELLVAGSSLR